MAQRHRTEPDRQEAADDHRHEHAVPAPAIRDPADTGAGEFYRKCGFREVARVTYKGTPLIYYEWLVKQP